MLHGAIDHIQCSWVKLGDEGCRAMLSGGADDLGGTLMEETISRMAGSDNGSAKTVNDLRALAESLGRIPLQRTTIYDRLPDFTNNFPTNSPIGLDVAGVRAL
jgi:FO synthase